MNVTAPLMAFYQKQGLLVLPAAPGSPEETFQRTMKTLEGHAAKRVGGRKDRATTTKAGGA